MEMHKNIAEKIFFLRKILEISSWKAAALSKTPKLKEASELSEDYLSDEYEFSAD